MIRHGQSLSNARALFAAIVLLLASASPVQARRVRKMFEPTDIEIEEPGTMALELQFGVVRTDDAGRLVLPDFELDLALLDFLELDVDGAYALAGTQQRAFAFSRSTPDSLWVSLKAGFVDSHDDDHDRAFALGVQLGPKLPVPTTHGVGFEGVLLAGTMFGPLHLVWNAGAFVDSALGEGGRSSGIELGLDEELDLNARGSTTFIASVSYVRFLSNDPDQLLISAGFAFSPTTTLELSFNLLGGIFPGGDRYGILIGVAPKFHLFDPAT